MSDQPAQQTEMRRAALSQLVDLLAEHQRKRLAALESAIDAVPQAMTAMRDAVPTNANAASKD